MRFESREAELKWTTKVYENYRKWLGSLHETCDWLVIKNHRIKAQKPANETCQNMYTWNKEVERLALDENGVLWDSVKTNTKQKIINLSMPKEIHFAAMNMNLRSFFYLWDKFVQVFLSFLPFYLKT